MSIMRRLEKQILRDRDRPREAVQQPQGSILQQITSAIEDEIMRVAQQAAAPSDLNERLARLERAFADRNAQPAAPAPQAGREIPNLVRHNDGAGRLAAVDAGNLVFKIFRGPNGEITRLETSVKGEK